MGDTGSLLLGLVNAVLVIRFINTASLPGTILQFNAAPAIGVAALFVPLMDTLRVTLVRVYHRRSPFDPDVNHIHHLLLKRGFSHMQITGILGLLALAFIGFAIFTQSMGINFVISSLFFMGTAIAAYLKWTNPPVFDAIDSSVDAGEILTPRVTHKTISNKPELNN